MSDAREDETMMRNALTRDSNTRANFADDLAEEDCFGYSGNADFLAKSLTENSPPFVAALCGDWGSGKSSMLYHLVKRIRHHDEHAVLLYFNAWQCHMQRDILTSFVHHIAAQLQRAEVIAKTENPQVRDHLKTAGELLFNAVVPLIPGCGYFKNLYEASSQHVKEQIDSLKEAKKQFRRLSRLLDEAGITPFVIIDDLDRCSPDKVVDMIEILKMVFTEEDELEALIIGQPEGPQSRNPFKYVLALDEGHIATAFAARYNLTADDAYHYVSKFIHYKYHFPPRRWSAFVKRYLPPSKHSPETSQAGIVYTVEKILDESEALPRNIRRVLVQLREWQLNCYDRFLSEKSKGLDQQELDGIILGANLFLFLHACVKVIYPSAASWFIRQSPYNIFLGADALGDTSSLQRRRISKIFEDMKQHCESPRNVSLTKELIECVYST